MAGNSRTRLLVTVKEYLTGNGLLTSGAFSDLTLTCGPDSYKVHKNIVCSRADFFARAIRFGGKEAEEGKIELPDDEPAIIKLLVQYLYEGEYDPVLPDEQVQASTTSPAANTSVPGTPSGSTVSKRKQGWMKNFNPIFPHTCGINAFLGCGADYICPHHHCGMPSCNYTCSGFTCKECQPHAPIPSISGECGQLLVHAKLYEIADKYDVVGLKDLVVEKFNRACHHFWDDPIFAVAAHHAFSTTPNHDKGLRDIVAKTISDHMADLVKKPEIEALLTDLNGLAFGLLKMKTNAGWR